VIEIVAGRADGAGDAEVDGRREDKPIVIIDVFPDEVNASGGVGDEGWFGAECLTEKGYCALVHLNQEIWLPGNDTWVSHWDAGNKDFGAWWLLPPNRATRTFISSILAA